MQTIGERLEEARKRKGISLREASEATKIRSDFLRNIEQNQLDFELPEIYKRGFVKNYSNYLDLDAASILTDYTAQLLSSSGNAKRNSTSELFGSMELKSSSTDTDKPSLGRLSNASKADDTSGENTQTLENNSVFYIKVGMVVLGVLAFLIVIIGLIAAVLSSDDDAIANPGTTSPTAKIASNDTVGASTAGQETVSLIAKGNVYVLVKQRNDDKKLVQKTLSEGEKLEFTKEGPIDIYFTEGENIEIVNPAGERLRPEGKGTAKISIP